MKKQHVTIYDVAREAKVSMATVSRVVNGNMNVKPSTREKVMKVIERLDYHPNAVARGLASKRTRSVGVIIPDVTNTYYAGLAQGISDIAALYKYNVILSISDSIAGGTNGILSSILSRQIDGLIYVGDTLSEKVADGVRDAGTPLVLTDVTDPGEQFTSVQIDNQQAFYEATTHLVEEGREHIAFVGTKDQIENTSEGRYSGYQQALSARSLTPHPYHVDKFEYDIGYSIGQRFIKDGIDAAIVVDDGVAVGILNALLDAGVSVPEAFSIITANNTRWTRIARPMLTSIEPPVYDIGAVAMRALTKLMDNNEEVEREVVRLPHRIIYRESTK